MRRDRLLPRFDFGPLVGLFSLAGLSALACPTWAQELELTDPLGSKASALDTELDGRALEDTALAALEGASEAGVEPLVKGPIHEAYAAPTETDPKPTPLVPKRPPADIDEEAPDMQPEGAIWIGGYWEWDDELKDFLWVSGHWRIPPPGMRWVPSYWTEAEGGWQRVPGLWIGTEAAELDYRPAPPESLEAGPTSPAPADNYFWIPGCWNYYDTGYRWRTGYWSPYQSDWVWVPARWAWTPAGFVQCPGFWDFRLAFRGQLFAPVCFTSPIYGTPGWRYRPSHVLDCNRLFVHLWIRPNHGCYYFGNYYDPIYSNWGFTPWCNWHTQRRCYDPLLTWCNVHYRRQGVDYIGRCQDWHRHFKDHDHDRPPRTFREQTRLVADGQFDRQSNSVLAADLKEVARRGDLPIKLAKVDDATRKLSQERMSQQRELFQARSKLEHEGKLARAADRDAAGRAGGVSLPVTSRGEGTSSRNGPAKDIDRIKDLQGRVASETGKSESFKRESFKLKLPAASELETTAAKASASSRFSRGATANPGTANAASSSSLPRLGSTRDRLSREASDALRSRSDSGSGLTKGASSLPSRSTGSSGAANSLNSRSPASDPRPNIDSLRQALESRSSSAGSNVRSGSSGNSGAARADTRSLPKFEAPKFETPRFEAPKSSGNSSFNRPSDTRGSRSLDASPRSFSSPSSSGGGSSSRSFEPRSSGSGSSGSAPRSFESRSAPKVESSKPLSRSFSIPSSRGNSAGSNLGSSSGRNLGSNSSRSFGSGPGRSIDAGSSRSFSSRSGGNSSSSQSFSSGGRNSSSSFSAGRTSGGGSSRGDGGGSRGGNRGRGRD